MLKHHGVQFSINGEQSYNPVKTEKVNKNIKTPLLQTLSSHISDEFSINSPQTPPRTLFDNFLDPLDCGRSSLNSWIARENP